MLVAALQPQHMSATALETIFEAAWAITNLAVVRSGGGGGVAVKRHTLSLPPMSTQQHSNT